MPVLSREERWSLSPGRYAQLVYPEDLQPEECELLLEWLPVVMRKLVREKQRLLEASDTHPTA